MLSKKFRLRKLNTITTTSVLMGAYLIFGQGQDASATGFRGVNSGSSGLGRGRGIRTPGSSSNLLRVGIASSSASSGTGSGIKSSSLFLRLGSNGGVRVASSSESSGLGSNGGVRVASSSASSGLGSNGGIRIASSSASSGLGSNDLKTEKIRNIFLKMHEGIGPNYNDYLSLLIEAPNESEYLGNGRTRYKYSSGGNQVDLIANDDGKVLSAALRSSRRSKFDDIRDDLEKNIGFPNYSFYRALLKEDPDEIENVKFDKVRYSYRDLGDEIKLIADKDGNIENVYIKVVGKEGYIDFKEGFSHII